MELAVRIKDKPGSSGKAGEVIEILPDSADWGRLGSVHPDWRIVRSPILGSHASQLMLSSPGRASYRDWYLDLSKMPDLAKGHPKILSIPARVLVTATVKR